MKKMMKIPIALLLLLYLIILTEQILFKYASVSDIIRHFDFHSNEYHWRSNNFIPFKTIIFYLFLADINLDIKIQNLVGNIIGFIPFGFMLPLLFKKYFNFKSIFLATFNLSFTYEILQLFFELGSFDVDDLLLNTLGGVLGYLSLKLFLIIYNFNKKQHKNNQTNV